MGSKIDVFNLAGGGVQLVKGPLHLADNEVSQAQNAEIVSDQNTGGEGVLSKRGGLTALNGSALAGSILGIQGVGLATTYTRTLLISKGTEDSTTWVTTTDAVTLANNTTITRAANFDKFTDENNARNARRLSSFRNYVVFPGNEYTQDTDKPNFVLWNGTTAQEIAEVVIGPSSNGSVPYAITDMLTADGKIFFAVHDPDGTAPNNSGRVMSLNLESGVIAQVAAPFGGATGEETGGIPSCMAWHLGQLFVGLNGEATTDGIGKVVRCRPDIDTTWTDDVTNLSGYPCSMAVFLGNLYVGTMSSTSTGAKIYKRTASTNAYTAVVTSSGGAAGSGHYASLTVYNDSLYAVEYHSTTPIIHIVTSSDGASWSTSRDVDANDGGVAGLLPGNGLEFSDDLLFVFRSSTASANDGFIMKRSSGTWSKLATDNYSGYLGTIVVRS